jgi:anti-sigma factor RsiW
MNDCQTYRNLIDEYLDGTITGTQLDELKEHARECRSCGQEFRRCALMQDVIEDAFAGTTDGVAARTRLMARLAVQPVPRAYRILLPRAVLAVAATVLVTVGLLLGFALGRTGFAGPTDVSSLVCVPMRVATVQGTVLVRHEGSEVWQALAVGAPVYLGDSFRSMAGSALGLQVEDDSTVEIEQNSMLVLKSFNGETQFFLEHGRCRADLESPHGPFFISTPHGRVEALGTEFTLKVE